MLILICGPLVLENGSDNINRLNGFNIRASKSFFFFLALLNRHNNLYLCLQTVSYTQFLYPTYVLGGRRNTIDSTSSFSQSRNASHRSLSLARANSNQSSLDTGWFAGFTFSSFTTVGSTCLDNEGLLFLFFLLGFFFWQFWLCTPHQFILNQDVIEVQTLSFNS